MIYILLATVYPVKLIYYEAVLCTFMLQEEELMENLFNCLCSLLLEKENRDRFLQGEGIQLMNLMLR
jgi:hypothetical protein